MALGWKKYDWGCSNVLTLVGSVRPQQVHLSPGCTAWMNNDCTRGQAMKCLPMVASVMPQQKIYTIHLDAPRARAMSVHREVVYTYDV